MEPRSLTDAAATELRTFLWDAWTKVPSGEIVDREEHAIDPNEMTSLAGEFESKSRMPNPHHASRASAG